MLKISAASKEEPKLVDLSYMSRWVAWAEEDDLKIPKSPVTGRNASSADVNTWGTRQQAEACWDKLKGRNGHVAGGIGFMLGEAHFGQQFVGIDLDSCLVDGKVADWAREVIARFSTYAEVSPSGRGIKLFFQALASDVARVATKARIAFTRGEHTEIAIDFHRRYYTVTGRRYGDIHRLRCVSLEDLKWLINDAGPRFVQSGINHPRAARDESGSGYGRRFFVEQRRKNKDYDDAKTAIMRDKGRAGDWARRVDERQLRRTWEVAEPSEEPRRIELQTVRGDEVEMEAVDWLWPGYLARGKLAIIAGDQERGKSQILLDILARCTRGARWPTGGRAPTGNVVLLTAEDDLADTVIPRFVAAGGDRSRLHIIKMTKHKDGSKTIFSLNDDLVLLEAELDRIGDVVAIGIDPVTAYLGVGKIDSFRATDVRGVMAPFQDLTERRMVVSILITHFVKNDKVSVLARVMDSAAFTHLARQVYVTIPDHEDPENSAHFLRAKNSNSERNSATGLQYGIEGKEVAEGIIAPHIIWGDEVTLPPDEAVQLLKEAGRTSDQLESTKEWLEGQLSDGDVPAKTILERAHRNNISNRMLYHAAKKLKVKFASQKTGDGRGQHVKIWSMR